MHGDLAPWQLSDSHSVSFAGVPHPRCCFCIAPSSFLCRLVSAEPQLASMQILWPQRHLRLRRRPLFSLPAHSGSTTQALPASDATAVTRHTNHHCETKSAREIRVQLLQVHSHLHDRAVECICHLPLKYCLSHIPFSAGKAGCPGKLHLHRC